MNRVLHCGQADLDSHSPGRGGEAIALKRCFAEFFCSVSVSRLLQSIRFEQNVAPTGLCESGGPRCAGQVARAFRCSEGSALVTILKMSARSAAALLWCRRPLARLDSPHSGWPSAAYSTAYGGQVRLRGQSLRGSSAGSDACSSGALAFDHLRALCYPSLVDRLLDSPAGSCYGRTPLCLQARSHKRLCGVGLPPAHFERWLWRRRGKTSDGTR